MSEEKIVKQDSTVVDKKALKAQKKAEKAALKSDKKAEFDAKPHRILDFLSREYKGENAVMLILALFAIVLGVLIVNNTLTIDEKYFLIGYQKGKLFAWILIGLAAISLIFVVIPFFRPSFSEIKHLKGLSKANFVKNIARTLIFIIIMCLFFLVCDLALDPLMSLIKK